MTSLALARFRPRPSALPSLTRSVEGRLGLLLVGVVLLLVVIGPLVAPYDPTKIASGRPLRGPDAAHLLGTDQLGRDVLSRVLNGGASVLITPVVAVVIAIVAGMALGMLAGYLGGTVDMLIARLLDLLLGIPPILAVLVIAAGLGSSTPVLVTALALVSFPKVARVMRGATMDAATRDFVAAAQARGESLVWILRREIAPNLLPTIFVEAATRLTFTIVFVATLSFLGLGAQPPNPNWGLMVADGRDFLQTAPLVVVAPAVAIALAVVGTHLLADALTRELTGVQDR